MKNYITHPPISDSDDVIVIVIVIVIGAYRRVSVSVTEGIRNFVDSNLE